MERTSRRRLSALPPHLHIPSLARAPRIITTPRPRRVWVAVENLRIRSLRRRLRMVRHRSTRGIIPSPLRRIRALGRLRLSERLLAVVGAQIAVELLAPTIMASLCIAWPAMASRIRLSSGIVSILDIIFTVVDCFRSQLTKRSSFDDLLVLNQDRPTSSSSTSQ